jgi:predicted nucleotide-binding protein (sugar kinase/HSP70/actin superfamily)
MKKVSFPYMGTSYIPFERLLKDFGNKVIVPPRPTEETISYGTKYAPEFACYPFKIVLGTYVQVLEAGADTLVSSGGVGPCRRCSSPAGNGGGYYSAAGYWRACQDFQLKRS